MEIRTVGTGCDDVMDRMHIQMVVLVTVLLVEHAKGSVALLGVIKMNRS